MRWITLVLAIGLSAGLVGCGSSSSGSRPQGSCASNDQCPSGQCCVDGQCSAQCGQPTCEQTCEDSSDCQGGCAACSNGCCVSVGCSSDSDCPSDGEHPRRCSESPDPVTGCRMCEYVRCSSDGDCLNPLHPLHIDSCDKGETPKCRNGQCQCANPCGGPCPHDKFCCHKTARCEPLPTVCAGVTCPACEMLNNHPGGEVSEESCEILGANCACVPMPPLADALTGQHSAMALSSDGTPVFASYYGSPYGDLVYGVASSRDPGASISWSPVDGIPADAPCSGAALGPRHGIAEPGTDVGWYTDLVVDAQGNPRISYFDRTNGDLKLASYDGGVWSLQVVDDTGEAGHSSAMILDSEQRPIIAYMSLIDGQNVLNLARALVPSPQSRQDWVIQALDAPAQPKPIEVAKGPSLALYSDGSPAVVYYDSASGNLKLVWWKDAAATPENKMVTIIAGEGPDGSDKGDLGADPSLFISASDQVGVAYQDAVMRDLYYMGWNGKPACSPPKKECKVNRDCRGGLLCVNGCCGGRELTKLSTELIDAGFRDAQGHPTDAEHSADGDHVEGNFAKVVIDQSGQPRVAYQDGTSLDLLYATRLAAGVWNLEVLDRSVPGTGVANGFFVNQMLLPDGARSYITHFQYQAKKGPEGSGIQIQVK